MFITFLTKIEISLTQNSVLCTKFMELLNIETLFRSMGFLSSTSSRIGCSVLASESGFFKVTWVSSESLKRERRGIYMPYVVNRESY